MYSFLFYELQLARFLVLRDCFGDLSFYSCIHVSVYELYWPVVPFGSPDKRVNPFAPAKPGEIEWRAYADSPPEADVEDGGSVFTL